MPLPESIGSLVSAARRRLVLMAAAERTILYVGIVAAASAGLLGVARHVVLPWAEAAALIGFGSAVAAAVVITLVRRPGFVSAAIEADNRLGSFDRLATAIELTGHDELEPPEVRQVEAASAWASSRSLDGFGALLTRPKLAWVVAFAVLVALVLALVPSPADAVLAEQREIEAILEEEAQRLEELAEEAPELVAETLEQTAQELREAESLEEALSELGEARQELAEQRDPADLARRTAVNGLERRLEQAAGIQADSLSDALQQLAQNLDQLTQEQLEAVSAALQQGADDLAGIDQPLSDALANAAEAPSGSSLSGAAAQAARAEGELAEGEVRDRAEGEVRDAQQRITDQLAGDPGEGGQPGQNGGEPGQDGGSDQGSDAGADSGSDAGSDAGSDSGSDSGQDGGSDSGQGGGGSGTITDVDNPGTGGSGTGSGQVGSGDDFDEPRPPRFTEIADQLAIDAATEERVRLSGSETAEEILGRDFGTGQANLPTVSYADQAAQYQQQALDALDSISIPPSLQDIIRAYFTELQP